MVEQADATPAAHAKTDRPTAPSRGRGGDDRGGRPGRGGRESRSAGGRGDRDRDRDRSREPREPVEKEFTETLIDVYRCSATVKGGRRLSFGALVAVGDSQGQVAIGYGRAKEVPGAIQKAIQKGRASLKRFPISEGGTIPHQVKGRFGASRVILVPARPGTGVIASAAVKAILEAAGLTNVLTKSVGSNNTRNVVKATMNALETLRSKEEVERLRSVQL
jgi:small subunit ribosomal protein S5